MKLPRSSSISQAEDFVRIRKTGHAKAGRFVIVSTLGDPSLPGIRPAFITSKRAAKKAHDRNLIRRRLRSYVQAHAPAFADPKRFLVTIARAGAAEATNAELEADWLRQCRRLKLLE
ncbi:ribonuclease P protein component [Akkermansiaceae bacterium]|nr:ribonuclease P protein component [Akkermansiaceae bacterium]